MKLRLFKLHLLEQHAYVVPATDDDGHPFMDAGVDLRGDGFARALSAARGLLAALAELEPGIEVRSLSMHLERERLLATLITSGARPRVARVDAGAAFDRLRASAEPLVAYLTEAARQAVARRPRV